MFFLFVSSIHSLLKLFDGMEDRDNHAFVVVVVAVVINIIMAVFIAHEWLALPRKYIHREHPFESFALVSFAV